MFYKHLLVILCMKYLVSIWNVELKEIYGLLQLVSPTSTNEQ